MRKMGILLIVVISVLIGGCAENMNYVRPGTAASVYSYKVVERNLDDVFNSSIQEFEMQPFEITGIDHLSKIIYISYHDASPEGYVDCGRIRSRAKFAFIDETFDIPGAGSHQSYDFVSGGRVICVDRKMTFNGQAALAFDRVDENSTRVTAHTRYIVNRKIRMSDPMNTTLAAEAVDISFGFGSRAILPSTATGTTEECKSTGKMENKILGLIK